LAWVRSQILSPAASASALSRSIAARAAELSAPAMEYPFRADCWSVRQRGGKAQFRGDRLKPPIARPQSAVGGQPDCGQKVGVDIADAAPEQRLPMDYSLHLVIHGYHGLRQFAQAAEDGLSLLQIGQREFADDKRMAQNLSIVEQRTQLLIDDPKMSYPHRSIGQDHSSGIRERGMSSS
jgi:hypothetical protein